MSSRQFVALWGEGDDGFAEDPPNTVLSFAEPDDRPPEDVVVVIQNPSLDGDVLQVQRRAPRRYVAERHRVIHVVHRPVWSSLVAGLGGRDASTSAPPTPPILRARSCRCRKSVVAGVVCSQVGTAGGADSNRSQLGVLPGGRLMAAKMRSGVNGSSVSSTPRVVSASATAFGTGSEPRRSCRPRPRLSCRAVWPVSAIRGGGSRSVARSW